MFNSRKFKRYWVSKQIINRGFVVLTITIILSLAGILFTVNMATSQLFDNYIIANYYRNNEAFANAESGINFVLSQLTDPISTEALLLSLPVVYENKANHFRVTVTKIIATRVSVSSEGRSIDESARREINLEVDFNLIFPIPKAAVSVNGKLNLDDSALVNDGCEGLEKQNCISSGNVAKTMLLSNPAVEINEEGDCSGDRLGENVIASNVLKGNSIQKFATKITTSDGSVKYDWGKSAVPSDVDISGITTESIAEAHSLFESTFSITKNRNNLDTLWDNAVQIDNSSGGNCSELLQMIDDEQRIIYIKGDCHISQYYAEKSNSSENKVFTIGSTTHPKLVFIEGGTFKTSANTGASVIGMLYFLPAKNDITDDPSLIAINNTSIDMGGVNVNGALLSEYKCSHDGVDKSDPKRTKQHFSVRFDKLVLDKLYSDLGIPPIGSHYRITAGTWRDF